MPLATLPDGTDIEYLSAGSGDAPPLLFVHGLGASATQFDEQVRFFSEGRRTISVSLRGHGRSSSSIPSDRPALEVLTGDVLSALDELGHPSAHWVGNSLGGLVSLNALRRAPSTVRSITTFGTTAELHTAKAAMMMLCTLLRLLGGRGVAWSLTSIGSQDEVVARRYGQMSTSFTLESCARLSEELADYDLTRVVRECPVPYLLLRGTTDRGINRALGSTLAAIEANPRASVVNLNGAGHFANMDDAASFDDALHAFLAGQSG